MEKLLSIVPIKGIEGLTDHYEAFTQNSKTGLFGSNTRQTQTKFGIHL